MRLIDADAIVFTHAIARSIDDGHNWNELCVTKDEIDDMPSAEPERKKGKWIGDFCSCCEISKYYFLRMVDDECAPFGKWNYCPNCGADMRGE